MVWTLHPGVSSGLRRANEEGLDYLDVVFLLGATLERAGFGSSLTSAYSKNNVVYLFRLQSTGWAVEIRSMGEPSVPRRLHLLKVSRTTAAGFSD